MSLLALRDKQRTKERGVHSAHHQVVGGRYRVLRRAGEGLSARVYFAEDVRTRQQVVVKQLTPEAARDSALTARFMREVHAIAGIDHPNVVHILDYGAPAYEQPYLVMEALAGEPLSALLQRSGNLSRELALFTVTQAAMGLLAVHRQGTVHRDVKPDNLYLVGPIGSPTGLKVIDFGMAKLADSRAATSDGRYVVGTLQYMPPEQVLADAADARSDVYSLGIVMFRALTGHLPFDVKEGLEMLGHQLFSPIPPLNWLYDGADSRISSIIVKATRKHPLNRYQSMAAFLSDLEQLDDSQGTSDLAQTDCVVEPDEYVPVSVRGKEIAAGLAQRFRPSPPVLASAAAPDSAKPFDLARKR